MKSWIKLITVACVVLCALVVAAGCTGMRLQKEFTYALPSDIEDIRDGAYTGNWDAGLVKAEVCVRMRDGKITAIDILSHDCGTGKAAEAITNEVLRTQSLDVDVVTGATLSSRTILKAVETALLKASGR